MQISKKRAVAAAAGLVLLGSAGTAGAATIFDIIEQPLAAEPVTLCVGNGKVSGADANGGCAANTTAIQVASDAQAQELLFRTQILGSAIENLDARVATLEAAE